MGRNNRTRFRSIAFAVLAIFISGFSYIAEAEFRAAPPLTVASPSKMAVLDSDSRWDILKIGGGGFLTGMDVAADGTMVMRANVYGAYIWNLSATHPQGNAAGAGAWQQLVNSNSMSAAYGAAQLYSQGVYEIRIAPSNSSIFYMMYAGLVFKSTDKGATWNRTTFTQVTANPNDSYGNWGQKMAVDPSNPSKVFVGTPRDGLFVTTNGGNSWSRVGGVPISGKDGSGEIPGITGIAIDPSSTNRVFAASYGNGVYFSSDGGSTWARITSGAGPATGVNCAVIAGANYYAAEDYLNLWKTGGSSWTLLLAGPEGHASVNGIAVDPGNSSHLILTDQNGRLDQSTNGGSSWNGLAASASLTATDIPWQQILSGYIGASALFFNPLNTAQLFISGGSDFVNATPGMISPRTAITWNSQGVGIEEFVTNEIAVPTSGAPLVGVWDKGVFKPDLSSYPSTFYPKSDAAVVAGWSVDFAPASPSFVAVAADGGYAGGPNRSGYSTDGGRTWTPFASLPPVTGMEKAAIISPATSPSARQAI